MFSNVSEGFDASFNSSMVRLRERADSNPLSVTMFQFQHGTIKRAKRNPG